MPRRTWPTSAAQTPIDSVEFLQETMWKNCTNNTTKRDIWRAERTLWRILKPKIQRRIQGMCPRSTGRPAPVWRYRPCCLWKAIESSVVMSRLSRKWQPRGCGQYKEHQARRCSSACIVCPHSNADRTSPNAHKITKWGSSLHHSCLY
jgi:hypothetical protein